VQGMTQFLQKIKKIQQFFSFFFTKSREQLKSKVQGVLQFLQFQKDSTVFQLFYKTERAVVKGAGGASVFGISKKAFSFLYKIERAVEMKVCKI
jgi:hypothetical protein